jgi:predicted nuclease of predicted toxin-antitoxin system
MTKSDDETIWAQARDDGFTLVSKDADFQQRSLVLGAPPKVVWLRVGNCPTSLVERLLRDRSVELHTFDSDALQSLLILA